MAFKLVSEGQEVASHEIQKEKYSNQSKPGQVQDWRSVVGVIVSNSVENDLR